MNLLQIQKVSHTYTNGVKALDNVSLELNNGMFGLLGPNGAGKSTLMRTLAGLQRPSAGTIHFNGTDIVSDPVFIKKQMGYLPQDFGVYPGISAYRLMDHLALLKGIAAASERKEQILALLQQTNLYARRHQAVSSFSGGMRQRFGIAQALLGAPRILVVDEPTAGLDPEERNRFNNLLSEIGEQVVVLLSTHLVEDVRNLCTTMAVIDRGRVRLYGQPETLIAGLRDKVWEKLIDKAALPEYDTRYTIISSQLYAGRLRIRIQSGQDPGNGFQKKAPDLEEVYFSSLA